MSPQDLVRSLIKAIGDDPSRPGLEETPDRVVRSWEELYKGYVEDPSSHIKVFRSDFDQVVAMSGLRFFSMCEHHILPFYGTCSIAYLPNESGDILGASKFSRIVNSCARKLQVQEKMTQQIAGVIQSSISPRGVVVMAEGVHLCMMARGVRESEATMITSYVSGIFREDTSARVEAFTLIRPRKE